MFSEILPGQISVASIFDLIPKEWSVIDCRPMIDGPGNSQQLIQSLLQSGLVGLENGRKICFACDYGQSRSNLLAALAVKKVTGGELARAVSVVQARHPDSAIRPGLLRSVTEPRRENLPPVFAMTGASGMLGKRLSMALQARGHYPTELSRSFFGDYLLDPTSLKKLIVSRSITKLIHLAIPRPVNTYFSIGESFRHIATIAEACAATECRLEFVSGWTVFDGLDSPFADEATEPMPHSLYGQSKFLQERFLFLQKSENDLDIRVLRLPGMYDLDSLEPRFLRYFTDCASTGKDITVHDFLNGSAVVPLVPANVAADALAGALLTEPSSSERLVHLSQQASNLSVRKIAEQVAERHSLEVVLAPVHRTAFNGAFASRRQSFEVHRGLSVPRESGLAEFVDSLIELRK